MSTESKIYWTVGIVSLLLMLASFILPGNPTREDDLPWKIEHPTPGSVRVFGLTLGEASAADAIQRFQEGGETTLFKSPDGHLVSEVYFDQIDLAGLRSKVVVTIAVPQGVMKEMYERGLRIAATGSGKKITLTPEDETRVQSMPIDSLTYMPGVRLEEEMILRRFGQPGQRIRETKSGTVHWLYPDMGVDITMGETGKPLMQYVAPRDFHKLLDPLKASGVAIE